MNKRTGQPAASGCPQITVSIASYNTRELLKRCLQSLRDRHEDREADLQVVVADNGSTDGTIEMVSVEFPEVKLIALGANLGYGPANNIALAESSRPLCMILNSDTEVQPRAISEMAAFLAANEHVGLVGPRLVLRDGSTQPSCGAEPGILPVLWEQTYLDKIFPRNRVTGGYAMTWWDYSGNREVMQICAAAWLVRRSAFNQIDGFDSSYFMYFEDTDFCHRLRAAGWTIWYVAGAEVKHFLGGSSTDARVRESMIVHYNLSRCLFFSRNSPWCGMAIRALLVSGALLRMAAWAGVALLRPGARGQAGLFWNVARRTLRGENRGASIKSS